MIELHTVMDSISDVFDLTESSQKKIILKDIEANNIDAWAWSVMGSPRSAYLFDVMIHNIDHAKRVGYYIPNIK